VRVRFWGVRGSVPWATSSSIGYGCNTPCVEIRNERTGAVLVLDAGSGIVGLSEALGSEPRAIPILLSHYHWDHVQGLPFVWQFYQSGWTATIWAPILEHVGRAWLDAIFQRPFFPVAIDALPSRPAIAVVPPGEMVIGGFRIHSQPLTHPGGACAYRIQGDTGDLVYATDHEFGGDQAADEGLAEFCKDAAAVILDAHYTPEELRSHRGRGHGSWKQCAELAAATGARRLWLYHHKPGRTDAELAAIEAQARELFPATTAASEGDTFEV
jgi:phosphoribosyl 1,2-cyclic phosphodiesterase